MNLFSQEVFKDVARFLTHSCCRSLPLIESKLKVFVSLGPWPETLSLKKTPGYTCIFSALQEKFVTEAFQEVFI